MILKPHEWQESIVTDWGQSSTLEELYQAFKARLIAELGVRTWGLSGPRENGQLIDRAPTGTPDA